METNTVITAAFALTLHEDGEMRASALHIEVMDAEGVTIGQWTRESESDSWERIQ